MAHISASPPLEPSREWLFKDAGEVFGPVPEPRLVELIVEGRVRADTPLREEGGAWIAASDVPGFQLHLRKAEARARVEAEVTGARMLAERENRKRWALVATGGAVAVALAVTAATWLAVKRPWEKRSELLADLGGGISVSAARITTARASDDDEVVLPAPGSEGGAPGKTVHRSPTRPGAARGTAQSSNGLTVLAHYDAQNIQAVVARRQGSLAPCFREEASRSPDLGGEIPIEFAVGNDGRLARLWVNDPRYKSGPLRDCLEARLAEWVFAPFTGERPVVSLSFRVGG